MKVLDLFCGMGGWSVGFHREGFDCLGVDIIEAGFPIASEGDFAAVRAVAAECRKVTVAALCRTSEQDVARAAEALKQVRYES